ncbi:hypothetical protein [Roseateles toxinivorans]|uniref:hypothetical protein n=1 Tax=Roseateles toxinivorans TaxID=270368 RepID=UPI00105D2321|nr:hypothetical protein [Roseateles toxinivorans]
MSIMMLFLGLVSPLVAFLWAGRVYAGSERRHKESSSFGVYLCEVGFVLVIALLVVAFLGRGLCGLLSFPEETCGWVAPFFLAPLLASISAVAYAYMWAKRTNAL